jgi:hypothetical protein
MDIDGRDGSPKNNSGNYTLHTFVISGSGTRARNINRGPPCPARLTKTTRTKIMPTIKNEKGTNK